MSVLNMTVGKSKAIPKIQFRGKLKILPSLKEKRKLVLSLMDKRSNFRIFYFFLKNQIPDMVLRDLTALIVFFVTEQSDVLRFLCKQTYIREPDCDQDRQQDEYNR